MDFLWIVFKKTWVLIYMCVGCYSDIFGMAKMQNNKPFALTIMKLLPKLSYF